MAKWDGVEEFLEVVQCGSFTAAAEKLGSSKSYVSKQIRDLEQRLNARLISRIVRSSRTFSGGATDPKALSERELKVLELLRSGKSTKEIAKTLDMSIRTVDIHRARIKRKLGLRTGAELIAFASSRL